MKWFFGKIFWALLVLAIAILCWIQEPYDGWYRANRNWGEHMWQLLRDDYKFTNTGSAGLTLYSYGFYVWLTGIQLEDEFPSFL